MANKNNIDSVFADIANSIRAKKSTTNPIQPINMAEEIDGIPTGITPSGKIEITNTEEIDVSEYASAQIVDSNLTEENIKEGVSILGKVGTFKGGGDTSIEDSLINGEISGDYSNDRITNLRKHAFSYCSNLTSVNLPNATSISNYAVAYCENLTSVNFPNATIISEAALTGCLSLTRLYFPNVTRIYKSAFQNCPNLTSVSLPQATSIGEMVFYSCRSLLKLVITQTNSVCSLSSGNAFTNCCHFNGTTDRQYNPTGAKDGRIYVPDELVESYKSAKNWSYYADIIVPLSTLEE